MPQENGLKSHLYRQSPVPLSDYLTLQELARELDIDLDRLKPLIGAGYLRILDAKDDMAATVVAKPLPSAMNWLRTMFMPLELRPLIPAQQICDALEITIEEFLYLCMTDNIPVYSDPAFGEVISISSFYLLHQGWLKMTSALRSDRQALMLMLGMMRGKHSETKDRLKPFPYSERIENEIKRIAAMPEPDRTLRATDFWRAYNDAEKLTDCLNQIQPAENPVLYKKVRRQIRIMGERMERQGGKKLVTAAGETDAEPSAS